MTLDHAKSIVLSALAKLLPDPPQALDPQQYLMKDMGLESIDLLNLMVEIERLLKSRLDLIEIMRGRDPQQAYNRDLKVEDLTDFLVKSSPA